MVIDLPGSNLSRDKTDIRYKRASYVPRMLCRQAVSEMSVLRRSTNRESPIKIFKGVFPGQGICEPGHTKQ